MPDPSPIGPLTDFMTGYMRDHLFVGEMVSVDGNVACIASAVAIDSVVRDSDIRLTLKLSDFDEVMQDGTLNGASAIDALALFASAAQVGTDGVSPAGNGDLASPVVDVRKDVMDSTTPVALRFTVPEVVVADVAVGSSSEEKVEAGEEEITYWGKYGEAFKSTDYKFKLDFIAVNGAVYTSKIVNAADFKRNKAFNKQNFKVFRFCDLTMCQKFIKDHTIGEMFPGAPFVVKVDRFLTR
jgi:hypothetical protein